MTDGYYSFDASQIWPLESISSDPTPILQISDPTIYQIAVFISEILNTNLTPRFQNEAGICGLTHANLNNWVDGYAVAQTIAFPLSPALLRVNDFKFPLLNIFPEEDEYDQLTLTNTAVKRNITVQWILPPLTAFQYNRMYSFLQYASKAILAFGPQGYDPKVHPYGPSVWKTAGISFATIHGSDYGHLDGMATKGNSDIEATFPALELRLSVWERNQSPVPQNFEDFTGLALLQENLYDGYSLANPIDNFIDGYVQPSITLTSCTPNNGTINGYTLIVIQGLGFTADKVRYASQLTIVGSPAAQLIVKSPTVLMAVTNPGVTGSSTGDIVFTDLQGNTYTLTNGFTYT